MVLPMSDTVPALYYDDTVLLAFKKTQNARGHATYSVDWREHTSDDAWSTVDADHIIGLQPVDTINDTYHLLFVEDASNSDDNGSSLINLNSFELGEPPKDVMTSLGHDHTPFFKSITQPQAPRMQVIVSVKSGTGLAKDFYDKVLDTLLLISAGANAYDVHYTTSEDSIATLAKNIFLPAASKGEHQAIVLLSGDGGMVELLSGLASESHEPGYRSPSVALIPLGTGNALANSTGVLSDKTFGLRTLLFGQSKELPKFIATFSPGARYLVNEAQDTAAIPAIGSTPAAFGCVVCSWGLHAALVADSDTAEYRKHGAERFKMAAKENLFPSDGSMPHSYRGKVSIQQDGVWRDIDRQDFGYVLVTMVSHLEAGFNISPESTPMDDVLRLVYFGSMSGNEAMEIMNAAYQQGKHVEDERVGYEAIDAIRIEFHEDDPRWRRVCIDGKIVRVEEGGWVEVRKDTRTTVAVVVP